ncbi:MAG TPA: hypothetical protein VG122_16920 [Gemmata sp.]|nr:hypothetical protein [Gemmata sp.]
MWKAHGTAGSGDTTTAAEPRLAGLFQTAAVVVSPDPIAVLEQPSSRRMGWHSLG